MATSSKTQSREVPLPKVFACGPVAPPVHGASVVNEAVISLLGAKQYQVETFNTAAEGQRRLSYHIGRVRAHLRVIVALLKNKLRDEQASIYLTGAGGFGIWYQAAVVVAARVLGNPVVYHHHSYAYINKTSAAMVVLTSAGGSRIRHVFLSTGMSDAFSDRYGRAGDVAVCSNLAFVNHEPPAPALNPDALNGFPRLGHLSNLSIDKGVGLVLESHRMLLAGGAECELHLAGPFANEQVAALVNDAVRAPASFVHYHGPLRRKDIAAFLESLDCFLFPSRYKNEAEPLVVLEALQQGVPVIAFGVGSLAETLKGDAWLASDEQEYFANVKRMVVALGLRPRSLNQRKSFAAEIAMEQKLKFGPRDPTVIIEGLHR